jgi:hypothetical protein
MLILILKDHRTNLEVGDIERVMNGDIDIYLLMHI